MEDEAGYLAMLERQMDEAACEQAEEAARSTYEQEWSKVWGVVRQRKHKGGRGGG